MVARPLLSIITVNYRGWSVLERLASALFEVDRNRLPYEFIVVDNHSDDGHADGFRARHPELTLIDAPANGGFSYGCNIGARAAQGELLLFLNPDTVPTTSALVQLVSWYQDHVHSIGLLSCRQSEKRGVSPLMFPRLATILGPLRAFYRATHSTLLEQQRCNQHGVAHPEWISGSVVLISRGWFDRVGGWDQQFWMYSEDVDLSKRVHDLGGEIAVLCDTYIRHDHGGTTRSTIALQALTKTEVVTSKHVYIQKHFTGGDRILAHTMLATATILTRVVLAILTLPLVLVSRLRVHPLLSGKILGYYAGVLRRGSWVSPRAVLPSE